MDILQIYVGFLLKTTIHVQYFNIYGHVAETCSFYTLNMVSDQRAYQKESKIRNRSYELIQLLQIAKNGQTDHLCLD